MPYTVRFPPTGQPEQFQAVSPIPAKPVIPVMSGDEADPGAAYEALDGVFLQEAPSPPPEVLATLETEEALFRLYWKTLPDKALARRTWPKEIQYFCRERGLGPEIMEALTRRCQDLRETRPSP